MASKENATRFFPLNRPEYVVNPELFQVALAWQCMGKVTDDSGKKSAFAYTREGSDPKSMSITRTKPVGPHAGTNAENAYFESLAEELGLTPEKGRIVGEAIANSLAGIKSPKAKGQCALPITLQTALLQDTRGVSGKPNPSNLGLNIDVMYWLGGGKKHASASEAWWTLQASLSGDFASSWIAKVTSDHILQKSVKQALENACNDESVRPRVDGSPPAWLLAWQGGTPFSWFASAWDTLCEKAWHKALPLRRWSDWASCVLRTGVGLGFLWEMNFYSQLAAGLLDKDLESKLVSDLALDTSTGLMSWDDNLGIASRDVASYLKRLVQRGTGAMNAVDKLITDYEAKLAPAAFADDEDGLTKWVTVARECLNDEMRKKLSSAVTESRSTGWNNTEETIRYALLCRDPFGRNADYYGLLRKHGSRYTIVAPSSEWLVVIASLAARNPGGEIHLDDLLRALHAMGLKPGYQTLITEVERAGLGRGSHDADEAISVIAAF